MKVRNRLKQDERGMAIVEAAMILPLCILMVLAVYYAAIFLCQKANLQANLENTLVYYKNMESDTYLTLRDDMAYSLEDTTVTGRASAYDPEPETLFPYRFFTMKLDNAKFEQFFRSMSGYMFFDDGDNVKLTVEKTNYVVYKSIRATAIQQVAPAVDLSMVGFPDLFTIKASGEAIVSNQDDFIRNTDLIIDLVRETTVGEKISAFVDKIAEFYNNLKKKFP